MYKIASSERVYIYTYRSSVVLFRKILNCSHYLEKIRETKISANFVDKSKNPIFFLKSECILIYAETVLYHENLLGSKGVSGQFQVKDADRGQIHRLLLKGVSSEN